MGSVEIKMPSKRAREVRKHAGVVDVGLKRCRVGNNAMKIERIQNLLERSVKRDPKVGSKDHWKVTSVMLKKVYDLLSLVYMSSCPAP